jgi:uncharacterized protein (DUF697 family)
MTTQQRSESANTIIRTHMSYATAAGLIPIPIADLAAVSAIHVDMLRQLAKLYEVDYSESTGKTLIAAVGGSLLARIGASAIKAIPGIGTFIGEITGAALSAATTYALGYTFKWHFEKGGNMINLDLDAAKNLFKEELEKGKQAAADLVKTNKQKSSSDQIMETIEKLSELQKKGAITEQDFETQKQRLLNQL